MLPLFALLIAAPDPCAIAILDFDTGRAAPETAKVLADALAVDLGERTHCRIITASDIRTMIDFESMKQNMGCSEGSCLAELGGALGVERVVTGDIEVLSKTSVVINARLADVKTASVVGRANITSARSPEATRAAAPRVARALLGIAEAAPPPPPPPIAAIAVGSAGLVVGALSAIAVTVGELSLGNPGTVSGDKDTALLQSRLGTAGVAIGVVGVAVGAVLFAMGGDA